MTVRLGIVLLVIGAICAFALTVVVPGVALQTVGWILMVAGILVAVLAYVPGQPDRGARPTSPAPSTSTAPRPSPSDAPHVEADRAV